jgi:cytochrome c-type biogenesis protein
VKWYNAIVAMNQPQEISVLIAFSAGLLSFISPCVLPLIPSYITYITGISFKELTDIDAKGRLRLATIFHSCLFIAGFSTIFILMGASASYLGQLLTRYQYWIMRVGGVLIIILGLQFVVNQLFPLREIFPFLRRERRFQLKKKPFGYLGSFLAGIVFAAGWTPCIGPILSTILIYASTSQNFTTGVVLLAFYSLGLGIPFFLCSLAFNSFLSAFGRFRRYMNTIVFVSGFFLIGIGILFLTDSFRTLITYLDILSNP